MREWGDDRPSESAFRRLLNALTQSAEYAVAAALLAVVLIVAATWWVRSNRRPEPSAPTAETVQAAPQASQDETARLREEEESAVRDLKQNLEARASEAERRRQQQQQAEEEARRRAEEEARLKAEEARLAAAAKTAAAKAKKPVVAKVAPAVDAAVAAPAPEPVEAKVVTRSASVDWKSCKQPQYPPTSIDRHEEGAVVLSMSVSAEGKVLDSSVKDSSGFGALDDRALKAISKCQFHPATRDGVAEASTAIVKFTWKLGE